MNKKCIIVSIPLVHYNERMYWGLYHELTGKARKHVKNRADAGEQVAFSFEQALAAEGDILIVVDDRFKTEKSRDREPLDRDWQTFVALNSLPLSWTNAIADGHVHRLVIPPADLACSAYTFSERKLYAKARTVHALPGECANAWTGALEHVQSLGYTSVQAYIPMVCESGICLATPYVKNEGVYEHDLNVSFTNASGIVREYK